MRGGTFQPFGSDSIAVLSAHAQAAARLDWFADEVVVDFPAMAGIVDRIKTGFIDERPRTPIALSVGLSPRQAVDGAVVPLSVPVRCTCRECGGRGELWGDACTACAGSGVTIREHGLQVSIPPCVADGVRFRFLVTPKHDLSTYFELHVVVR